MTRVNHYDRNRGIVDADGSAFMTYEILGQSTADELKDFVSNMDKFVYRDSFAYDDFTVAAYGEKNDLPEEMRNLIRNNPMLPEILKKQVRFMYGDGPFLYREEFNDDNRRERTHIPWNKYQKVKNWLESWKKNGLPDDYRTYLKKAIMEYYYTEGIFSGWHFNRSRRTNGRTPVRGLEYIPSTRARLAMEGFLGIDDRLEWSMLNRVIISYWDRLYRYKYNDYPLFDESNPLLYPRAVNYVKDVGFGEEIYSYPTFYYGLKEWIKGSNLNPKYINSYLKNSMNAKIHVLIPNQWIEQKEKRLKEIVDMNQQRDQDGKNLITEYDGLEDVGTTFDYSMIQKLIDVKLQKITQVLSGGGENQGKIFTSRKFQTEHGVEEWEFKEIPTKYKEFVTSIIEYDKRTVEMIVAGKGIDPSISNISKEGIFQSSGSNSYYNYLIYLNQLSYAEEFITEDINRALWINFPGLRREDIKLGFYRNVPQRQEELKPDERMEQTTTS